MKRKIFSQISLLLALFTIAISLSACGTSTSTSSNAASSTNYTQGTTQNSNIPSPQTKQS